MPHGAVGFGALLDDVRSLGLGRTESAILFAAELQHLE